MSEKVIKILLVESDTAFAPLLQAMLSEEQGEFAVTWVRQFDGASYPLAAECFDALLLALDSDLLDPVSPVPDLEQVLREVPHLPVLVLTAEYNEKTATQVIRAGAQDYLVKRDINHSTLTQAIHHAIARIQRQQQYDQAKELAQVTLRSIGEAVITTDIWGQVQFLNPTAEALTGWRTAEAQGYPLTEIFSLVHEGTREPLPNPVATVISTGKVATLPNHTLLISRNGREFAIDDSIAPIRTSNHQIVGAVLVFRDVTAERDLTQQLSWQASHDGLTGLINRTEFERRLQQTLVDARSGQQTHVLCYLDLDNFKIVNDTCGHAAGDTLLQQISFVLQTRIRKTDALARLGGDEFGILLLNCSINHALSIAQTILESVQQFRFVWQDKVFTLGVSIGLVTVGATSTGVKEILVAADSACYRAKSQGHNRVHVYRTRDHDLALLSTEHQWVSRITAALEHNQFRLYYQPTVSIASAPPAKEYNEVLLRLIDRPEEPVSPLAFMAIAERYNLMPSIDRWVIQTLFAHLDQDYREWSEAKEAQSTRIFAINISAASLKDPQFLDFLREQFATGLIPPQAICFEIAETVALMNLSHAVQLIQTLKRLGCYVALDDFGSRMSSFTYLKSLPIDFLKIDGYFVKDIATDPIAHAVVEVVNRISHAIGIQTIAEFAANATILEKVRLLGFDYAQGYGIARPQPLC